jgi:hypothetical protein
MKYTITPKAGEPFELDCGDVIAAMDEAEQRLGTDAYSIRKTDHTPAPLFGTVTEDGRIQL